LKVANFDSAEDDELIKEIKADYDFIRNKLITKGFKNIERFSWQKCARQTWEVITKND